MAQVNERVLDTDVVSFIFKNDTNDTRATKYLPLLEDVTPVVSFMTVAELYRWALQHRWGTTRTTMLERYLRRFVVHPYTADLCRIWAEVTVTAQRNGRTIGVADAWHAAVAMLYDIPLITNNASDYEGVTGLTVLTA